MNIRIRGVFVGRGGGGGRPSRASGASSSSSSVKKGMWAASLGRGQKLNAVSISEDGEALERQRREWLRRVEAPRGRAANALPHAVWEPSVSLARVTRDKGRDLSVLGHHANGVQWLRPEEALCLFEDSLIALHVAVPKEGKEASSADGSSCPVDMSSGGGIGGGGSAPLSVQEAYQIVLGGSTPLVDESVYCVYAHLYRANFVAKVRSTESLLTPASPSATGDGVAAAAASAPIALFDVYHRRNFSRRQAAEGTLPPMYIVAVFGVHHRTPPLAELARLRDACAPTPLRFACTWQHDVLFFKPQWPAQGHVHVPADVDMAAAAAAAAAAEEASGENGVVQRDNDEEVAQINASLTPVGVAATAASNAPPSLPPSLPPSPPSSPLPPLSPPPSLPPSPPPATTGGFIISGEDEEEEEEEEGKGWSSAAADAAGFETHGASVPVPVQLSAVERATPPTSLQIDMTGEKDFGARRAVQLPEVAEAQAQATPKLTQSLTGQDAAAQRGLKVERRFELERLQAQHELLVMQQRRLDSGEAASGSQRPPAPASGVAQPAAERATLGAGSAPPQPPPVEGRLQQQQRKLGDMATKALRASFMAHTREARANLEATAQSASHSASTIEQSAMQSVQISNELRVLARSLSALRDDDALGNNASLFPRASEH